VLSTPPAFVLSQDQTLHQGLHKAPTPAKGAQKTRRFKPIEKSNTQQASTKSRCQPKEPQPHQKMEPG
jgi:hypothetical protein